MRHTIRVLAVAAIAALSTMCVARPALAQTNTSYQFGNGYAGLCLDAQDDATHNPYQNGDRVQLWSCSGDLNQSWVVVGPVPGGWYQIENFVSGTCLDARTDASYSPYNNGDPVQMWSCDGNAQQQWYINGEGDYIVNLAGNLVLDARWDSTSNPGVNGDPIQLWQRLSTPICNPDFPYGCSGTRPVDNQGWGY